MSTSRRGMGGHVTWEAPSLLVKGYDVPYAHPKYPENKAVAGSLFHTTMDQAENQTLAASRARASSPCCTTPPPA